MTGYAYFLERFAAQIKHNYSTDTCVVQYWSRLDTLCPLLERMLEVSGNTVEREVQMLGEHYRGFVVRVSVVGCEGA